jgi:hypothetical protein
MDEIALGEGGLELGKSVFAIDTATDMTYSDLIDLSIVKVKDDIASQCQFGLRTSTDNNVLGQIVEEDVVQEINQELKVYKWGAKSQLTRGTYTGWIALRNQNRVRHHVQSDTFSWFLSMSQIRQVPLYLKKKTIS